MSNLTAHPGGDVALSVTLRITSLLLGACGPRVMPQRCGATDLLFAGAVRARWQDARVPALAAGNYSSPQCGHDLWCPDLPTITLPAWVPSARGSGAVGVPAAGTVTWSQRGVMQALACDRAGSFPFDAPNCSVYLAGVPAGSQVHLQTDDKTAVAGSALGVQGGQFTVSNVTYSTGEGTP